uniref:M6 family metalloprotease domain-containing protein n=1 Tax=Candidatus Kentrum sp. FW TaxID=2126338 RepID=A0A450SBQ7_9GAMM|nr:MAG: M6 family metalloprotease domain-containing protein [Candidatus Kentron sp. FW]VFJ52152.1 MAG: M6 family metalloprotease domain-containing protein [Candidatus Kentron sp. FW]
MSVLLGQFTTFPQGDGPDIQLKVFGDEFYARYENREGYTVVYDPKKEKYCYAMLEVGHLVSSGIPADQPAPKDLPYHVQEDKDVRNEAFTRRHDEMRPKASPPPGVFAGLGENNGLLYGQVLSVGNIRGLTIIVDFQDVRTSITAAQVDELVNGDNFTSYGNHCSMKEYFRLMSSGKLEYTNQVVGPVLLSRERSYYINNPCMKEALDKAVSEFNIDMSAFDSQGRGVVDAINFVYAGQGLYQGNLWPHNFTMLAYGGAVYNGIRTDLYTIQGLGIQPVDMTIGTLCHEAGHLVCRFPDLYDYGNRDGDSDPSSGLGYYCLMAAGGHLGSGRVPAPICAYLRDLAGWTTNEVSLNAGGNFQVQHGNYGDLYKYKTGKSNEYFLIENKTRMGIDQHCPSTGLAVYHCDTRGSNEWQDGTAARHYQCALIQADGKRDMETNPYNRGDSGDLFRETPGIALSHNTTPSSRAWGGTDSGLKMSNITAPGSTIRFDIGDSKDPDDPVVDPVEPSGGGVSGTISKESWPSMLIPDRDPAGITDTVLVTKSGKLTTLDIEIDITHSYVGDIKIELITPHGTAVLRQGEGGCADDLMVKYSIESSSLTGEPIAGKWGLKVSDLMSGDIGRLNRWKIEIGYTS